MGRKKEKKGLSRGEDWDISESAAGRILDVLITLIVMCAFLFWFLITFSVKEHIVLIVLVPLLFYFTVSSPGLRLRLKERWSNLLVTDILILCEIAICCLFADHVYAVQADNMELKLVFSISSAVILSFYLSRAKFMYYLIVPVLFIVNMVVFTISGFEPILGILLTLFIPLPFCVYTFSHPYYFGFGRVKVKGKYRRYPESVAKRMRAKQADERKAERCARAKQESKRL